MMATTSAVAGSRGALLDPLAAQADEAADLITYAAGGLPARQFGGALLAIAGEPAGVDRIRLAEAAERAAERSAGVKPGGDGLPL